jgi:DNA-binding CsgD family transcriptional regulator
VTQTAPDPRPRSLLCLLLDPRERDVLQAYANGLSSQEIADQLGTDLGAIQESIEGAMRNLGASTRLEAVLVAFRLGLLKLPS